MTKVSSEINRTTPNRDTIFWDRIAEKYARDPIKDMASYEYTLERTRSYLLPSDRVLELGCGTGSTALLLAPSVGHITATDFSPAMIDIARQKLKQADAPQNVIFQPSGPDGTNLPAARFDAVLAFNMLHLVHDLDAVLAQVASKLRPGGMFISKTVCLGDASFIFRPLVGAMKLFGKAPHVSFLRQEALDRQIAAHGFRILETGNFPRKPPSHFVAARLLE
ncbi:MAG: class I SAM-dependent methyltransferase [Pannonibacter sp.]